MNEIPLSCTLRYISFRNRNQSAIVYLQLLRNTELATRSVEFYNRRIILLAHAAGV